jgi:hypothetical protein
MLPVEGGVAEVLQRFADDLQQVRGTSRFRVRLAAYLPANSGGLVLLLCSVTAP